MSKEFHQSSTEAHHLGGKSAVSEHPDHKVQVMVDSHKSAICQKAGIDEDNVKEFKVVAERHQVVAGIAHYVKISIGDHKYLHVKIWDKVGQSAEVTQVETDKTHDDVL